MGLLANIAKSFGYIPRSSIQNPSGWMLDLYGTATKSGIKVNSDTALAHATIYACNKVLGEAVASLPVGLFEITETGSAKRTTDPRNTMISAEPSELYHSYDFRVTAMLHIGTYGNFYALIIRNGVNRASELRIIHPSKVTIALDSEEKLWYKIAGREMPVQAKDMIHIKGLSSDGITGKSPIEIFRENIALGIAAVQTQGSLWKNGTFTSGYLSHPNKLGDGEGERLRLSWASRFSGSDNAGRTPVLENGMQYMPLTLKPADAMFVETVKMSREDICAIYRVPPHMVGDLTRSTNNNIEHQSLEFVQNTLLPHLKSWEQELNRKLLTDGEKGKLYFRFNVDGLLRGDTKSRAEYFTRALGSVSSPGWMTVNEVRALDNLDKTEDGDTIYSPLLNNSVDVTALDNIDQNGKGNTDTQNEPNGNGA